MKSVESHGKSVELAIEAGLSELKTTKEKVKIEILSQGGLFRKASVRLTLEDGEGERALRFVEGLIETLQVSASAAMTEDDENVKIDITGVDIGTLIGHRGEVLDAIQYLASMIANKDEEEKYKRVTVDGEGYRVKRVAALEELADHLAEKAIAMQRSVSAEPMNPFERRAIHARLQNNESVTTHSEGEEPYRYLVVTPKGVTPGGHKTFSAPYGGGRRNNNFGGGQRQYGNNNRQGGGNNDRYDNRRGGGYGNNDRQGGGSRGNYGGNRGGGNRYNDNRNNNSRRDDRGGYDGDNELLRQKYGDEPAADYGQQQQQQPRPAGGSPSRQQFAFRSSNKKPSPYSRLSGFSEGTGVNKSGFSDGGAINKSGFSDGSVNVNKSGFSDDTTINKSGFSDGGAINKSGFSDQSLKGKKK